MHELSVCMSLISQVERLCAKHHATRVHRIQLQIGPLSGVEGTLLQHAFPIASAGSLAENSSLDIDYLPIRVQCHQCGSTSEVAANKLICKHCGNWQVQLISGDEMLLASLEFDIDSVVDSVDKDKAPCNLQHKGHVYV